eukprot:CAMPEP_0197444514 /NCGR_PEP_ID=MMETSP1175-20131217/9984_1 /TAXON_ID=1003142 /ORGANISM="Triceratium dubium, Strain CCMP147" /LENGTH=338 /DNA_ID=CAMNT_0042975319 /DNA_START=51 /DNA_END=1067 /DNA_ORIENTATION=-
MIKAFVTVGVLAALVACASAACPNQCSGHGRCGSDDVCSCFYRWTGNDCGQRLCKEGLAWVDGSDANPHSWAECSNKGICDRDSGECQCFPQYDGAACERSVCPNDCSGHGTCEYIHELSTWSSTNWDYWKIQGCKCDGGWDGTDCSKRLCPKGDDPLTIRSGTSGQDWTFTFSADGGADITDMYAYFEVVDLYGTTHRSRPFLLIDGGAAGDQTVLTRTLLDMPCFTSLDTVTVSAGPSVVNVVLEDPYRVTDFRLVYGSKACRDAGCYPLLTADTVTAGFADDYIDLTVAVTDGTLTTLAESAECSNRGDCDYATGICKCYEGHFGLACERQTILV